MASLQRFTSHGRTYWRLVESYRRPDGRPAIRTLVHLGRPDDLVARLRAADTVRVHSVSCGAVDALWQLAHEFALSAQIDAAVAGAEGRPQIRDGLSVGDLVDRRGHCPTLPPEQQAGRGRLGRHDVPPAVAGRAPPRP